MLIEIQKDIFIDPTKVAAIEKFSPFDIGILIPPKTISIYSQTPEQNNQMLIELVNKINTAYQSTTS